MNLVDGKNSRIRLVYAYEDTENKYVYVGLTKNLSKRHYQHCHVMNGKKDRVFRYFENNNKTIPKPIVLDENLTREESQEKEGYWADYYVNNGWTLINKAKTGLNVSSLGGKNLWNIEERYEYCKKLASECKNRSDLWKKHPSVYCCCLCNKWLSDFFGESKRKPFNYWTIEKSTNVAKTCSGREDFFTKYPRAYDVLKEHGLLDELFGYLGNPIRVHGEDKKNRNKLMIEKYDKTKSIRVNSKILGIPKTTLARLIIKLNLC